MKTQVPAEYSAARKALATAVIDDLAATVARDAKGDITDALILAGELSNALFEAVRRKISEGQGK